MIKKLEQGVWNFLLTHFPRTYAVLFKRRGIIAFIIAGGFALLADIAVLYVCKSILELNLALSVAIAFLAGFSVSFLLQKFWTFEDVSVDRVHTQLVLYFLVAGLNLLVTEILMHLLVGTFHFWYIGSKILVAGGIACVTFFIYKLFIFKRSV